MLHQATRTIWFVIFTPARHTPRGPWWGPILHPAYRHVMAVKPIGEAATQIVNHTGSRLVVDLCPMPAGDFLRAMMADAGAWVLAAEAEDEGPGGALLRGPMTCVEAVKAALGIGRPFLLTPRQLQRYLTRRGARPVLPLTNPAT